MQRQKRLLNKVLGPMTSRKLAGPGDSLLVAVSGGPDSVALLDALASHRDRLGIKLAVAHLNHGLRGGESNRDQRFVQTMAKNLGLRCWTGKADVGQLAKKRKLSIETAAREARREFLSRAARRLGCTAVVTGHTRDDQAETVLMHLARGSGLKGLAGIPWRNGIFIRPMLDVSRQEVMDYLAGRKLKYCTDSTNQCTDFTRNKVRLRLLPAMEELNPNIKAALARLAEAVAGDIELVDESTDKVAASCISGDKSKLAIDLKLFNGYNKGLQRNLIRICLQRLRCHGEVPNFETTERVLDIARRCQAGKRAKVLGNVWAIRGHDSLVLADMAKVKAAPDARAAVRLALPGSARYGQFTVTAKVLPRARAGNFRSHQGLAEHFDLDRLPERTLYVGRTSPGQRMSQFGMAGSKKISDIFTDTKVPREQRSSWPAVLSGDRVLWLCGIRRSGLAPVEQATNHVLRLELKRHGS